MDTTKKEEISSIFSSGLNPVATTGGVPVQFSFNPDSLKIGTTFVPSMNFKFDESSLNAAAFAPHSKPLNLNAAIFTPTVPIAPPKKKKKKNKNKNKNTDAESPESKEIAEKKEEGPSDQISNEVDAKKVKPKPKEPKEPKPVETPEVAKKPVEKVEVKEPTKAPKDQKEKQYVVKGSQPVAPAPAEAQAKDGAKAKKPKKSDEQTKPEVEKQVEKNHKITERSHKRREDVDSKKQEVKPV